MKLFITLILVFTISSNLFGQEQTSLDELITMKLPPNIKKTDYDSIKMMKGARPKSLGATLNSKIGNLFETSAGIIQINAAKGKAEEGRLENLQKGLKEMYGWGNPKYLTSQMKSINNFTALLINYQLQSEDIGRMNFFTVNNNQDIVMSGTMEYAEGNSEQALKSLDEFLKGLYFK